MGLETQGRSGRRRSDHSNSAANEAKPEASRSGSPFSGGRFWVFAPGDFLPDYPGEMGFSVKRMMAATTLFAVTLVIMRVLANVGAAAIVLPLWCAAVGCMLDGFRGAARGFIIAIVYPIYFAINLAIGVLVFWGYALIHRALVGEQVMW
ncbi:MAG: hypothetical protein AB8B50_03450 [Pirellulaceae bacterium]